MTNAGSQVAHLISRYFNQLLHGCGNSQCENPDCVSSSSFAHGSLTPNEAAILAVQLTSRQAHLCCSQEQPISSNNTVTNQSDQQPVEQSRDTHQLTEYTNTRQVSEDHRSSVHSSDGVLSEDSSWSSILPSSEVSRLLMLLLRPLSNVENAAEADIGFFNLESDRASLHSMDEDFLHRDAVLHPDSSTSYPSQNNRISSDTESLKGLRSEATSDDTLTKLVSSLRSPRDQNVRTDGVTLTELQEVILKCQNTSDWSVLTELLTSVFSSFEALSASFPSDSTIETWDESGYFQNLLEKKNESVLLNRNEPSSVNCVPPAGDTIVGTLTISDLSSDVEMGQPDETNISSENSPASKFKSVLPVNIRDVRLAWSLISEVPETQNIVDTLMRAVRRLVVHNLYQLLLSQVPEGLENPDATGSVLNIQRGVINVFLILYECPFAKDPSHFEHLLLAINRATTWLPISLQARLCRSWSNAVLLPPSNCSDTLTPEQTSLWSLQRILLQHITLRCLTTDFTVPNEDKRICEAAQVLRIVYYASILAGEMDPPDLLKREMNENKEFEEYMLLHSVDDDRNTRPRASPTEDPLAKALGVSLHNCRKPFIPYSDFVNETLNDAIKPKRDYINYRTNDTLDEFSFMRLPFLLQTKLKSDLLHYDSRSRMLEEQRGAIVLSLIGVNRELPVLKLHVSRERIIEDTLLALEITCMERPSDLKKQLLIEFEGEQGIDEGGLSKEFFQLIIEKILDPIYGMFVANDELGTYWFNPDPFDDLDREYCLIGILMGLAIYNEVILNVRFPSVLYRKLSGKLGTFEDLKDARPDLIPGLQALLDYEGDDIEQAFDCTFVITYEDPFGNVSQRELVPDGSSILVNKANRQDFVNRYADFILNSSVKKQFSAFRRGFQMVVDESPINFLFRADEIELLVRGSMDYDFTELERVTKYDGYTAASPVIKYFWTVVHEHMTKEQQCQLLQFATGSDRIPAGGMSQMKFTIAKQGADPERLPTAHTCFNILLLPEYQSLDQLKRLLLLAIAFCKGFGMS